MRLTSKEQARAGEVSSLWFPPVASHNAPVSLRDRLRRSPTLEIGKNIAAPEDARRALARALERQDERLRRASLDAVDIQLLGQVTGAAEWSKLLAYWERRNPSGVGGWPRKVAPEAYALNLWPLPAGRVGRPVGLGEDVRKRQPKKLLCTPGLTLFDHTTAGGDATTALAVVCATWLEDVGMSDFQALRLAPPILEAWAAKGRLVSREVLDFGLEWSLPAVAEV